MRSLPPTAHRPRPPSASTCTATPCCTGCGASRRSVTCAWTIPRRGSTCISACGFATSCRQGPHGAPSRSRRRVRTAEHPCWPAQTSVEQLERVGRVVHEVDAVAEGSYNETEERAAAWRRAALVEPLERGLHPARRRLD